MIRKYRYDQNLGKMVEVTPDAPTQNKSAYVMEDLKPYQVVGPEQGKWITSRSQHRDYLKRHNLIEVGNEKKYFDGTKK